MFLHPIKVHFPIYVTLFGILILVSDQQYLNASSPIFVTPSGILILVSDLQSLYLLLVDYQYYTL